MTAAAPIGPYDEVVSLGRSCQVAHQLRHQLGLERAHVFDWVGTTDPGLLQLIETGLNGYFSPGRIARGSDGYARDPETGTSFVHELPPGADLVQAWQKSAPRVAAMVARWQALVASDQSVLFIRQHGWKPDPLSAADRLLATLAKAAPRLRFRLLYLTSPDLFQPQADRPDLIHRPLPDTDPDDWRGDDAAWKAILDEARHLPPPRIPAPTPPPTPQAKPQPASLGPYDEVVSLGRDCQPAHQLRRCLGIERAHVFDWIGTTDTGIVQHIESRLDGYFTPETLGPDEKGRIRDRITGTSFLHIFPPGTDLEPARTQAAAKVAAMVDRWRELMQSDRSVLFIRRHGWTQDPLPVADRLVAALAAAAPRLRFRLLYLTAPDRFQPQPDRPHLIHRRLPDPDPPDWRGDGAAWQALLDEAIRMPLPPRASA